MPGQSVNFFNLLDPQSAIQQQELERRQQLVDALRQDSLSAVPTNQGPISWTQGAAKMGEALASVLQQKRINKRELALALQRQGTARELVGAGPNAAAPQPQMPQQMAPPPPPMQAPPPAGPAQAPQPYVTGAPQMAAPPAAAPDPNAQAPAGATPPQSGNRAPLSLSGNHQQDFMDLAASPEDYFKAVIASHSPTDLAKQMMQAGVDPNGPLGKQIMQANIAKQNYVAPIAGRPGATIRDPFDPSKVVGYDAPTLPGGTPQYGPGGEFTGYKPTPGAADIEGQMQAAKSAAEAQNKPVAGYDQNTGQPTFTNAYAAAHGAPAGGGSLNKAFGGQGGVGPAPPLGATTFADTAAKKGAQYFSGLAEAAADAPNRIYSLKQMYDIASGPTQFGPGSETAAHLAGGLNRFSQSVGLPPMFSSQNVSNQAEFGKWASQYSARMGQDLGLSGSDARVQLSIKATPNGQMNNDAIKAIIPQMIGLENARAGMATAGAQYARAHPGPNAQGDFLSAWRANYEPRIYTWMAQGPAAFAANVKHLSPVERQQMLHRYDLLKGIGALPQ